MSRLKIDRAPTPVLLEGDARVLALKTVRSEPQSPFDYVAAIEQLWGKAQSAFLEIGRLLMKAKETLPHGEYMSSVEERLPFASQTAYQLREAARWALEMDRQKTITFDCLPGSYSTIYLLSTLDPPTLQAAKAEGLVRPELRRAELIAWRRGRGRGKNDRSALQARRDKLVRERIQIEEEIRRLEVELSL